MERVGKIVISDDTDFSVARMWATQIKGMASVNILEESEWGGR